MPQTVARLREAGRAAVTGLQAVVSRTTRGSTRAAPGAGVGRPALRPSEGGGVRPPGLAGADRRVERSRLGLEGRAVHPPAPPSLRCLAANTYVRSSRDYRYMSSHCEIEIREQFSTVDHSARASMKNAASCVN
jgi:hypothetical protein